MKKALLIVSVAVFGLSFGCGGKDAKDKPATAATFTDTRDGKVYRRVKIGTQVWMAENLNFAANGSMCYENKAENCAKYGRLYDWNTAMKACPAGTHLPDDDEWYTLRDYANSLETAGTRLKSTNGWKDNDNGTDDYGWWAKWGNGEPLATSGNGTDDFGFVALPGGFGHSYPNGKFYDAGRYGYWWSATEVSVSANSAWGWFMSYDGEKVDRHFYKQTYLFSVRCVQDKRKEAQK